MNMNNAESDKRKKEIQILAMWLLWYTYVRS